MITSVPIVMEKSISSDQIMVCSTASYHQAHGLHEKHTFI